MSYFDRCACLVKCHQDKPVSSNIYCSFEGKQWLTDSLFSVLTNQFKPCQDCFLASCVLNEEDWGSSELNLGTWAPCHLASLPPKIAFIFKMPVSSKCLVTSTVPGECNGPHGSGSGKWSGSGSWSQLSGDRQHLTQGDQGSC